MSLKLPNHLCEEDDPLAKAKAYSLQLLLLTERIGGKESSCQLLEWIGKFNLPEFLKILTRYEDCQKIAQQVMPFIKTDIKAYKSQFDCEYIKKESQDNTAQKLTSGGDVGDSSSSSCNRNTPLEVDGFLYDDLNDALKTLGLKSDRLCATCNSSNVIEQDIVFMSSSIDSLINLYVVLLRGILQKESDSNDDGSKKIGILGSGLGFMVYCAFFFTNIETIISYETDSKLYQIQEKIIDKYGMKPRVKLIQPEMINMNNQENVTLCNFIAELDIIIIDGEENTPTVNEMYTNVVENYLQNPNQVKDGTIIICHDKNVPNYSFLNNTGSDSFLFKQDLEFSTQEFSIYKIRK